MVRKVKQVNIKDREQKKSDLANLIDDKRTPINRNSDHLLPKENIQTIDMNDIHHLVINDA